MKVIFKFLPPPLGDINSLTGLGLGLVGPPFVLTICFIENVLVPSVGCLTGLVYIFTTFFFSSRAVVGDFSS
jgi:hypothetical protein